MPMRSIMIKANVALIMNFPERSVSFSFRYAANMIAPGQTQFTLTKGANSTAVESKFCFRAFLLAE